MGVKLGIFEPLRFPSAECVAANLREWGRAQSQEATSGLVGCYIPTVKWCTCTVSLADAIIVAAYVIAGITAA